ncbi:MAG: hypothetical protein A2Y72_02255 [Chloroflexi bacterium RBG_13_53_26]|nr:MAG: hypothetical protein A2Y72_02255 [Chloroflexi bacterium RBG_13_53_26]
MAVMAEGGDVYAGLSREFEYGHTRVTAYLPSVDSNSLQQRLPSRIGVSVLLRTLVLAESENGTPGIKPKR